VGLFDLQPAACGLCRLNKWEQQYHTAGCGKHLSRRGMRAHNAVMRAGSSFMVMCPITVLVAAHLGEGTGRDIGSGVAASGDGEVAAASGDGETATGSGDGEAASCTLGDGDAT
jgi:hypothetical protein